MELDDRLRRAGLSYVITEYRDVLEQMAALDEERGMHSAKVNAGRTRAALMAYKWALLNNLPMGGAAFVTQMQDHAEEYRREHAADIEEYLAMRERREVPHEC